MVFFCGVAGEQYVSRGCDYGRGETRRRVFLRDTGQKCQYDICGSVFHLHTLPTYENWYSFLIKRIEKTASRLPNGLLLDPTREPEVHSYGEEDKSGE